MAIENGPAKQKIKAGIAAFKAGNRSSARSNLQSALQIDPQNITALLWLAYLSENFDERTAFLEKVLAIDPKNERAQKGLVWAKSQRKGDAPSFFSDKTSPVAPIPKKRRKLLPLIIILLVLAALLLTTLVIARVGMGKNSSQSSDAPKSNLIVMVVRTFTPVPPIATAVEIAIDTATPLPLSAAMDTASPTATEVPSKTPSSTPTNTATASPVPPTAIPSKTPLPLPPATATPLPVQSTIAPTQTPLPTSTATSIPTPVPPTATQTQSPPTATNIATATSVSPTETPTQEPLSTPTDTVSVTPTSTPILPIEVSTQTPVPTDTATPGVPTDTPTVAPSPTPLPSPTPIYATQKWIEVDLSDQTLVAWEGNVPVMHFIVSTGLPGTPTVVGSFHIYQKLVSTRMVGPGYDLPNVPHTMYFYLGYALHGAYWHNNFGHPMSHGCVNLSLPDAERLFNWATPVLPAGAWSVYATANNPGSLVVVHY